MRDRERGCVAGENRPGVHNPLEFCEKLFFSLQIPNDGLNHYVAAGEVLKPQRRLEARGWGRPHAGIIYLIKVSPFSLFLLVSLRFV